MRLVTNYNILRRDFLPIDPLVCVVVRSDGRTLQRNACKQTARTRIAQYFSTHRDIGFCRCVTTNRSCCYRRICSELHFAAQDSIRTAVIHHEKDEVSRLPANLKAYAATLKGHHGGRAPGAVEIFASAARHRTAAITTTDHKRGLQD